MRKKRSAIFLAASLLVLGWGGLSLATQSGQGAGAMSDGGMMHSKSSAQAGAPIYIGPSAVRQIQEQLSQQGQQKLKADGMWGPSTARAVQDFQKTQGLVPTGNLNIETVQALGLTQILSGEAEQQSPQEPGRSQKMGSHQGTRLYISPGNLSEIQRKLSEAGYPVGEADGAWGAKTEQAIRQYQQDKGLSPTGNINLNLIEDMGFEHIVAAFEGREDPSAAMATRQPGEPGRESPQAYFGQTGGADPGLNRAADQSSMQKQGSGAPLFIGPETVRQIQQKLSDAGYQPDNMDGAWTSSTQKALMEFQQSQNLEPTGNLTPATVQKLIGGFDTGKPGSDSSPGAGTMQNQ